jgi:hypothetical protein
MALCCRLVLSGAPVHKTAGPGPRLFLAAWGQTQYSAGVQLRLSRATQKRVTFLRELFKVIQVLVACQAEIETFSRFPATSSHPARISRTPRNNPIRNSATMANNQTPNLRARSTQLLNNSNSNAVAWVWIPVCPCFQACLNLRPRPRSNAWTALRRSLNQQLRSHPSVPSHPIVPRCEAYFSYQLRIPHFSASGNFHEPHPATARPTAAKLEYQPTPAPASRRLWRTCGTRADPTLAATTLAPETRQSARSATIPGISLKVAPRRKNIVFWATTTP